MPDEASEPVQSAYLRALYASREELLREGGLRDQQLRQLRESFARFLADVVEDQEEGRITEERAEALRSNIRQRMADLGREWAGQIENGAREAAQLAADGHAEGLESASEEAGIDVGANFAAVPQAALEGMFARRGLPFGENTISETFQTLVARNVEEAAEDIDRAITSAVARGVSNQRLTREIAQELAGDDEELREVLSNLGARGGRTLDAIEEDVEVPSGDLNRAKSLLYDARRIAVTEINNAHTAADDRANVKSPVVVYVRWTTSSRHEQGRWYPDVCTFLEQWDHIGEGAGVFPAAVAPANPHPFCMCWRRAIVRPESDWGDPMPEPERAEVPDESEVAEALREWSGEEGREITENFARRQRERAAEHIRLGTENAIPAPE
jgi:flagellar biosynthesis/type III secretory pathway protein FliH